MVSMEKIVSSACKIGRETSGSSQLIAKLHHDVLILRCDNKSCVHGHGTTRLFSQKQTDARSSTDTARNQRQNTSERGCKGQTGSTYFE